MDAALDLSKVDFRTTPFENIFLDTYLGHAPEHALRVYLYGFKACYGAQQESVSIDEIKEALGLSAAQLSDAVEYWVGEGLVVRAETTPTRLLFRSMLLLWAGIGDLDGPALLDNTATKKENESDSMSRSAMFDALEDLLSVGFSYRVMLKENEIRLILDKMDQYGFSPDYFLYAYDKAKDQKEAGARSVNYIVAIIENWARFDGITTREALDAFLAHPPAKEERRSRRRKKRSAAFVETDERMSREDEQEWVRKKLEESRKKSLRGGSDARS